jgi:DNA polymerase-4
VTDTLVAYALVPSFYAWVERVDDPALRGRPVLVGGNPNKRGKVQSASGEALSRGVQVGMLVSEAVLLCPDAAVSPTNMKRYREVSSLLLSSMRGVIPRLEADGLNAAYLDLPESQAWDMAAAEAFVRRLCGQIKDELGLPLKVGIASLKFLAPIAADECGDEALYFVAPGDEQAFLQALSPARLPGVGAKTLATLRQLHVERVADLVAMEEPLLEENLGNHGRRILALARGIDPSRVRSAPHSKSMSQEFTFSEALLDRTAVEEQLALLWRSVEAGLKQRDLCAGRVAIKIRYADRNLETRSRKLVRPILDSAEIFAASQRLLDRTQAGVQAVVLIGVSVSDLDTPHRPNDQLELFGL